MNSRNFFGELKRRNVYKVAVAYAVVAWLLIQIATQVLPFFEIPNWGVRLVVLLVCLGFPIALLIAWAFELTPEGLKRTEVADRSAATSASSKRTWIYVVIIAGVLSIGLFFLGRYTATDGRRASASLPAKSIAVLPFENLSRDPDNAYFTEGVQDEIITRLAKIAELKVISRTSTQRFRSSPDNLDQIARQLGVANILEGSVQKAADQVRVNVQLVNAATDAHLWAESFDRKLTDIFAVESEIAQMVADTLQAKLTGSEKHAIGMRPTEDPIAYQLYLKGRSFLNKRTANDLRTAIGYFEQAIDKDPGFALAYAGVADAYALLPGFTGAAPRDAFPKAKAAAQKALELDSALAEAHTSLAIVLYAYDFDFTRSLAEFKLALELNPNYATAHHWLADTVLLALGHFDDAIAEMKRALELDPLSVIINADFGAVYLAARRFDEGIDQLHKTLEMDPNFYYTRWNLGSGLEFKGLIDQAITEYEKAYQLSDDPFILGLLGHAYAVRGRKDDARKILAQLQSESAHRYVGPYSLAIVYLGLGDKDEALRWLEKAFQERAGYEIAFIKVDQLLDPLHGDPRFEALVQKVFAAK
jgi:TolB-like protein/Flp pilus assembly protein TadD